MRVLKTASRVHWGPIWNPSRYHYACLTCIHVLPHLHPCPKYLVPPPPMYHVTSIQLQKFFFNHHPYRGSPPFRPHLNSMQVAIWFSPPPMSRPISTQAPRFTSSIPVVMQLNPESHIFVSSQPSLWLTPMQIPGNASQSHPGPISQGHLHMKMYVSPPYMSFLTSHSHDYCLTPTPLHPHPPHPHHPPHQPRWCLTSIHVPGFLSHLHPGIASTPSRSKNSSLTMIHIVDHIYQGSISPKCRSKCEFHLHPRPISSPSRPIDSHLASIQVVSHLNPGLYMCVPSPFRWRLSSNQVTKIASLFHPGNISTTIEYNIFASYLKPGPIFCNSPPSSSPFT